MPTPNPRFRLAPGALLRVLLVALFASAAVAQTTTVPASLQASIFDKVFGYDRALSDRSALRVLLVHDPASGDSWRDTAAELRLAFGSAGLRAEVVAAPALSGKLEPGAVVYLLPGTAKPELLQAIAGAKALSISGDAALAEQGLVTVGIAMRGDKSEIVVNLDRMQQEGHDLSAQLLKFARVIRGAGGNTTQQPTLIGLTKPDYPAVARRLQVQGDVVMKLQIDEAGKVVAVELVKGVSRTGGIDDAAIAAAKSARFKPATRDGKPVAGTYTLTMPFRL